MTEDISIGDRVSAQFWYDRQWIACTGIVDDIYQYTDEPGPGYQVRLDTPLPNGWKYAQSYNVALERE